jgi:uncharacterized protein (DUF2235 family)
MRRLVVCTDGTWNSAERAKADGEGRTNVARFHDAVVEGDVGGGVEQRRFYDPGVGTGDWWDRMVGGAFGTGLSRNIRDCYAWLVANWRPGDELYFVGFSRGAYTARSLSGLVRNAGILRQEEAGRIGEAYDLYRDRDDESRPEGARAREFRARHAVTDVVPIRCVAVWDTVGSLGVPTRGPIGMLSRRRNGFHDVTLSGRVEHAFHALAIDERRKPFAPTLWEVPDADARERGPGRVQQVWFAGVHSNVGGGYPDTGLSDLALAWMYERVASCGLVLRPDASQACRGACDGKLYDSMTAVFRVMGAHVRPVRASRTGKDGAPVHTFEEVHPSAIERRQRLAPAWDPENMRALWDALVAQGATPAEATRATGVPGGTLPTANAGARAKLGR